MTAITNLLAQGADEIRRFKATTSAAPYGGAWLDRLADRLSAASTLGPDRVELEVRAIAHALLDSGPFENEATPSFWQAVDALQRKTGRR